jgi:hypothetical protein
MEDNIEKSRKKLKSLSGQDAKIMRDAIDVQEKALNELINPKMVQ